MHKLCVAVLAQVARRATQRVLRLTDTMTLVQVARAGRRRRMLQDVCKGGPARKRIIQEFGELLAANEKSAPLASQASLMSSVLRDRAEQADLDEAAPALAYSKVRIDDSLLWPDVCVC